MPVSPSLRAQDYGGETGLSEFLTVRRNHSKVMHLEALNMKGSMRNNRGQILALIETPDQQIERVQVGNYMGMNQGPYYPY
ncbi:pilus assembly protein PilP [Acinetobacter baumannii]